MPIEIEMKPEEKPCVANSFVPLYPLRIAQIKPVFASTEETAREKAVREYCFIGDICVLLPKSHLNMVEIFNCRSGTILESWFCDYLWFITAPDVKRVVIAKPEN